LSRVAIGESPSVVITSDSGNEPSLAVRSDGRAVVAWYDGVNSSTPVTWASEYDPVAGTWSVRQQISDPSATDSNATAGAAIGTAGLVIVWQNTHALAGGGQDSYICAKTKAFADGGTDTFTYGYDRLSRLTSVTGPDGNPTYAYDPSGALAPGLT
jgi:YD repeat-containing protein